MSELTFDVGLAYKLMQAFQRNNWTSELIDKLCQGDTLSDVCKVLLGHAEVKILKHIINLNADPFIPNGWKVEQHWQGGSFKWDPAQVQFYLSESQRKTNSIEGAKLREELKGKPVFNANLLDYLLAYPKLIPEEWKQDEKGRTRQIFFWGTIYYDSYQSASIVRYLWWINDKWEWNQKEIRWEYGLDGSVFAALHIG